MGGCEVSGSESSRHCPCPVCSWDGKALETGKRATQEFKMRNAAARLLFKLGIADFGVKLKTSA